MTDDMMIYAVAGLAFLAIAGIGLAFAGDSENAQAAKRAKQLSTGAPRNSRNKTEDAGVQRRKQTQQMLQKLRDNDEKRRKSLVPQDTKARLAQAGLDVPPAAYWVFSVVMSIAFVAFVFSSGAGVTGLTIKGVTIPGPVVMAFAAVGGFLGVPRWFLSSLTKRRSKKLTNQFADGIDIIVRGVKSGLPLNECLRIIARESPAPLGPEFETLTDNLQMGATLEGSLQKFYARVPLQEVNFFVIVLTIQSKAGGNLSEALGNLSAVIRQRRGMREKVKALSSEAKASAMIIGSLPFAVGTMVYLSTPEYIMELFRTETGHMILAMGACLMATGIGVMKKMINFDM